MPTIFDVYPDELIKAVAEKLKETKHVKPPKEGMFWKTGHYKEFPPTNWPDFWYLRAASIMRKLYRKPIGINRLRKLYGGRKTNHVHINHTHKGSGAIIRRIIQQLEKEGLVKQTSLQNRPLGRILTPKGRSLLDKTAAEILKEQSQLAQQ